MKIRHAISLAIPAFRGLVAFLCIAPVLHAVPVVTTNPATALGTGTATLNGAVVAGDAAAEVYFEWGLDPDMATAVSTLAGTAESGSVDGPAGVARFYNPQGLAVDAAGVVYVADTGNGKVRKIYPNNVVTTLGRGG